MENFFTRYKNPLVLMAVLFIQVVALATQVKRQENGKAPGGGPRLIRVWTVTAFTPVEKMFVSTGHFFRNGWHNYVDLRNVRKQNQDLQNEVSRLQMEQARMKQDAEQAHRLQALLDFKERYVGKTVAAQVIGTSGTEQSRMITIDKGAAYGIKPDAAVITPDGIVGKVKEVYRLSSQVLLINDHDSGAGVILENTRLQGIVKGTSTGQLQINGVMSDEEVDAGEHVITSGGDQIFPKGLSVGTVISSSPDRDNDPFLNIKIKPTADLNRLEEVLVVTEVAESAPVASGSVRAADILSQRLPSIPKQDPNAPKTPGTSTPSAANPATNAAQQKPAGVGTNSDQKPSQKPALSGGTAAANAPLGTTAPAKPVPSPAKQQGASTAGGSGSPATTVKPTGTPVPGGTGAGAPSKPTTKTAGTGQPQSSGTNTIGAATPGPTPKPKVTPPKKVNPPASGTSPSTPQQKKPDQPEATPTPTPTATPGGQR